MKQIDSGTTVYYTLDLDAPPNRLSAAERAILRRRPIDFTDIPPQTIDET